MTDELTRLQTALLDDRPREWPKEGPEALRQHKLLAAAVHRATTLAATGDKEGEAWVAYFVAYFPEGPSTARAPERPAVPAPSVSPVVEV